MGICQAVLRTDGICPAADDHRHSFCRVRTVLCEACN
ncbi:MAG: hypothetical protein JNM55_13070 [Anaerolineales bacterium]|nr:hypothetical protein [Anaerolineales bacterium]